MDNVLDRLPQEAAEHLAAFKRAVESALPDRVARMTLFGSRARGDAEEDSDYDVAVFVRDLVDRRAVEDIVTDAAYDHMLEGVYISPIVLPEGYLESPRGRTALAEDIAREGIALP
jgi:predicted nucleotidyltransferase